MIRLVVLGGSSVSTPALALALEGLARRRPLELVLHGQTPDKLAAVATASRAALAGVAEVTSTTDLDRALDGADLVLSQVRVGGFRGRGSDERFPRELGLVGEETLGAGGFANALRTIPVALELARRTEARAPGAAVVNLTNPSSLVQQALVRYAGAAPVSVCDVPVTLAGWVHRLAGAPPGTLRIGHYGTNHLSWVTRAIDPETGGDLLPEVLARVGELDGYPFPAPWVQALGVLPGPHLRYLWDRDRHAEEPAGGGTRGDELLGIEDEMVRSYARLGADASAEDVRRLVARRGAHWYEEIVVPVLEALVSADPRRLVVQVPNAGLDPRLPPYQTVETPAAVSSAGVTPEPPPALPPDCRALLDQNAAYEELAVAAIVERDRTTALRALTANALVGTRAKAEAVLAVVWPEGSQARAVPAK